MKIVAQSEGGIVAIDAEATILSIRAKVTIGSERLLDKRIEVILSREDVKKIRELKIK